MIDLYRTFKVSMVKIKHVAIIILHKCTYKPHKHTVPDMLVLVGNSWQHQRVAYPTSNWDQPPEANVHYDIANSMETSKQTQLMHSPNGHP